MSGHAGLVVSPTVSELAAEYDMSFAAVQKHVAKLEEAGLKELIAMGMLEGLRLARGQLDELLEERAV